MPALAVDLGGVGLPMEISQLLGYQSIAVSAAGTATGTATVLTAAASGNVMYTVTTGASQQGVRMPAGAPIGTIVFLDFAAATPLATIYPETGGTLNILSADTGIAMTTANKNCFLIKRSATNWRLNVSGAA